MIYFEPGMWIEEGDAVHRRDTAVYRDPVRAGGEPAANWETKEIQKI